jgi:hypothetical protein
MREEQEGTERRTRAITIRKKLFKSNNGDDYFLLPEVTMSENCG